jgi:hypothetical protein
MGATVEKAAALKKAELVRAVAEAAAARRWVPACLRWPHVPAATPEDSAAEPDQEADRPAETDAEAPTAQAA